MAMFNGTSALSYNRCKKHGRYEFECEQCVYEERRSWAVEDALAAVEEMKREMYQYGNSDVKYHLGRLEEALKEMEVNDG